jgi:hypothetical protein
MAYKDVWATPRTDYTQYNPSMDTYNNNNKSQDIESMMKYQQHLSQNQLEQVANYISSISVNMETSIKKKVDLYGHQVKDITQSIVSSTDRLDTIVNILYVIIALVVLSAIVVPLLLFFYIKHSNSKIIALFNGITKNVINTFNIGDK